MKNTLVASYMVRAGMACVLACGLGLTGCGSNPDRDRPENPFKKAPMPGDAKAPQSDAELHAQVQELYRHAHQAVADADWTVAADRLNKLIAAYPFSDYATQAEMEKIWVGYKGGQPEEAISDADRFLRAHPRTPQAEYVQYLKGVINFGRDDSFLEAIGINSSPRKDVSSLRRSYEDFALLLQRYPASRYAGDARRRMIYLRDRIADHDMTVADYYLRRGAYIAAARRAQNIIAEYPGAPATQRALALLETSYQQAGLKEQADDTAAIIAANADNKPYKEPPPPSGTAAAALMPTIVGADGPPPPPTLLERIYHALDIFDTTKAENQHVIVIPSGNKPAQPATAPAGTPTPAAPSTSAPAAPQGTAPADGGSSTTAPASGSSSTSTPPPASSDTAPAQKTSGFKMKVHAPGDDDPDQK